MNSIATLPCRSVALSSLALLLLIPLFPRLGAASEPHPDETAIAHFESSNLDATSRRLDQVAAERTLLAEEKFLASLVLYLQASEHFAQSMFAHGAKSGRTMFIPVPTADGEPNPNPQLMSYRIFRSVFEELRRDLNELDLLLESIEPSNREGDEWKLAVDVLHLKLDLDGDGEFGDEQSLISMATNAWNADLDDQEVSRVAFDQADVYWLRAQSAFVIAICDYMLAHDFEEYWNITGPMMFGKTDSPFDAVMQEVDNQDFEFFFLLIHELRAEVIDRQSLRSCRERLVETTEMIEQFCDAVEQETDNDREWFASPQQDQMYLGFPDTGDDFVLIKQTMTAVRRLLEGEQLLPFISDFVDAYWDRGRQYRFGINLKSYFEHAEESDFLLLVHGYGAAEFVEEGNIQSAFWSGVLDRLLDNGGITPLGLGF